MILNESKRRKNIRLLIFNRMLSNFDLINKCLKNKIK